MRSHLWLSADQEVGLHSSTYGASEFECPPHTHSEYILIFCLDERMEVAVRGRSYVLDSGDLLVINPGDLHSPSFGGAAAVSRGFGLAVTPKVLRAILGQMIPSSSRMSGGQQFALHPEAVARPANDARPGIRQARPAA